MIHGKEAEFAINAQNYNETTPERQQNPTLISNECNKETKILDRDL